MGKEKGHFEPWFEARVYQLMEVKQVVIAEYLKVLSDFILPFVDLMDLCNRSESFLAGCHMSKLFGL